jgi:hypothetical protein
MNSRQRVPGATPEPGWTMEEHQAGSDVTNSQRVPLTTNQHILHLLLTVFTAGLWAPVWFYLAVQGTRTGTRTVTPGEPTAPMPVWPPLRP